MISYLFQIDLLVGVVDLCRGDDHGVGGVGAGLLVRHRVLVIFGFEREWSVTLVEKQQLICDRRA